MQMMIVLLNVMVMFGGAVSSSTLLGVESASKGGAHQSSSDQAADFEVERVGGLYRLEKIESTDDHGFRLHFVAKESSGRFDHLILDSSHLNFWLKEGAELRISAEVVVDQGTQAQVSQVVIFTPQPEGDMPVWMLSSRFPPRQLSGASYIDMHAPQTDYMLY